MQSVSLLLLVLAGIYLSWADLGPNLEQVAWLQRAIRSLIALACRLMRSLALPYARSNSPSTSQASLFFSIFTSALASSTSDTGAFSFFDEANIELVIKILDACGVNGNFWVFVGGLTNVGVTITVTDTVTQEARTYTNPVGTAFQTITDTGAFPTC